MASETKILVDLEELIRVHPSVNGERARASGRLPEDVTVRINGTDLMQMLFNLAVNAFQCLPGKHAVRITASRLLESPDLAQFVDGREERLINREGFRNGAPLLVLSVADNGPGIPAEILPKIFDPYFTTKAAAEADWSEVGTLCKAFHPKAQAHSARPHEAGRGHHLPPSSCPSS